MKTYPVKKADGTEMRVTVPPKDDHLEALALAAVLREQVTWFVVGRRLKLGVAYPHAPHGGIAILRQWTSTGEMAPRVEYLDDMARVSIEQARKTPFTPANADVHALAMLCGKAISWRDAVASEVGS